tara:strand:+ start:650 stop:1075 length:426 start_codon:yes stop_codon:yes gene_type:complete
MTSQLNVDTIKGKTTEGSISIQGEGSATTNLQQGLAKMWGSFDQRGDALGSVTSGDTFNVTSITDALEGHLDVSIANDMVNVTYSINATSHYSGTLAYDEFSRYSGASNMATGSFRIASQYTNGGEQDAYHNGILVHGDLA